MASKTNIFSALPQHHSDSEDDDSTFTKNKAKKPTDKGDRPRQDNKNAAKGGNRPAGGAGAVQRADKEEHARQKEPRRDKGVSDQPHPLDRHSGTGNQAYGAKPKKSGAGKGNWGNYRDDKRPADNLEERQQGAEEGEADVRPLEEEKPSLTLQEYYQQQNFGKAEQQVNEAKAKITSDQLLKEMGTATLLKGRHAQEVDDRKAGKKKERLNADHHAGINTEHANLLGFRTGFIEKEYRQRGEGESPTKPTRGGPRGGPREPREQENAKEEETQAGTQAPTEGQEAQAGEKVAEGQQQATGGQDNRRRQEGGRGGQGQGQRGGDRGDRGGRGGNRPQGERRQQGGKQNEAAKISIDDSAFPKLG